MPLNILHRQHVDAAEFRRKVRHTERDRGTLQRLMLGQALSHHLCHSELSWIVDFGQ